MGLTARVAASDQCCSFPPLKPENVSEGPRAVVLVMALGDYLRLWVEVGLAQIHGG